MATESRKKKVLGILDTADSKIGYLAYAVNKSDRAWLANGDTADVVKTRLRNLINTCEAILATIDVHVPAAPPKAE